MGRQLQCRERGSWKVDLCGINPYLSTEERLANLMLPSRQLDPMPVGVKNPNADEDQ